MATLYRTIQNAFGAGVLSSLQEGAVGSSAYAQGLSIAENVSYGTTGLYKRLGTRFGIAAKSSASVLFRYWKDEDEIYMLECWEKGARLIDRDGNVASTEVVTPYLAADLKSLSVASNLGSIHIVHRLHKPAMITVSEPEAEGGLLQLSYSEISFVEPIAKPSDEEMVSGDVWTSAATFDAPGDYPSEQIFYGGRWFLMSTDNDPLSIWFSRSMDATTGEYRFNDFTYNEMQALKLESEETIGEEDITTADCGGVYQSSDMYGTRIRWAMAHQTLLIGAGMSIYQYTGGSALSAVVIEGASVFSLSQAVALGASGDKAVAYNSYVFFAGIGGHSLMCMNYSQEYSSYTGVDISEPVADYLRSGIKTICVTEGTPAVVWVLTNDGQLLACHFSASTTMIAWSIVRFSDDDKPLWIEALESDISRYSTLCLVMDRAGKTIIETLEMAPATVAFSKPFLDAYVLDPEVSEDGTVCIPEFAGRSVEMVEYAEDKENGAAYTGSRTVTADEDGYIEIDPRLLSNLDQDGIRLAVGLRYTMLIGTLRSELPANGTSQSAMRSIKEVTLRLHRTLGGFITTRPSLSSGAFDRDSLEKDARTLLYRRYGGFRYGEPVDLYTGDISTSLRCPNTADDRIVIFSSDPYPFCVCALIIDFSIQEV